MEEKMKDSGIKWIGKIPEDWTVKRLKYCVNKFGGGGTPESSNDEFYDDEHGVNWVAIGDMSTNQYIESTDRKVTELGIKDKQLTIYPKGTVIYSIYATIGKVAELKAPSAINQALLAIIENKEILNKNYLKKYLNFLENIVLAETSTNTQANLNLQKVQNFMICLPPLIEQQRIAEFLDKKCADIDEIISKTEKQIETLEQYKKSLITETVTKGLNTDIQMVFSNVKQIGNVPKHWNIKRIRYVLNENNGIKVGPFGSSLTGLVLDEGPVKIYGQWNVVDKSFNTGKNFVSIETYNALKKYEVKPNDILISMMGTIGGCIIVPKGIDKGIMDSHIIKIRLKKFMNPKYFYYFYDKDNSYSVFNQLEFVKTGSIMDGLNSGILKNINICIPPLKEQDNIVEFLDEKCNDIDEVLNKQKESLETLKKYKQSLIYEYVTGKKRV